MSYKILLIEDDPIISEDLKKKLNSLDYWVIGITDQKETALQLIDRFEPDLILADIILETQNYDGIDLVKTIFEQYQVPVIYLTASSELTSVKKATASQPAAFLLKPYRLKELAINIDLALKSFKDTFEKKIDDKLVADSIFIPKNSAYQRIPKKEILYIEADGSYTKVITQTKTHSITLNLKHFNKQLSDEVFIRVSRKHVVNSYHIESINGRTLYLSNGKDIPISKLQSQEILKRFPILKTR